MPKSLKQHLDARSLEIVKRHWTGDQSLDTIAAALSADLTADAGKKMTVSAVTLRRYVKAWIADSRFVVAEDKPPKKTVELDTHLALELIGRSPLRFAVVADVPLQQAAFTEDFLAAPDTPEARNAYEASDQLHRELGEAAADYLLNKLHDDFSLLDKRPRDISANRPPGITLGLAGGRAVGFTVWTLRERLAALDALDPKLEELKRLNLASLCGGGLIGGWAHPAHHVLDADHSVFALQDQLRLPPDHVHCSMEWLVKDIPSPDDPAEYDRHKRYWSQATLDVALVGVGQLNSGHHFFKYTGNRIKSIATHIKTIQEIYAGDPGQQEVIGEIAHRLFFACPASEVPRPLREAVNAINERVATAPVEKIRSARDIVLVAGGRQKLKALLAILKGECSCPPLVLPPARGKTNITLVTDTRTAKLLLEGL